MEAEKAFSRIQHPLMIKSPKKLCIEGFYFNIIKAIYKKMQSQHHTEWEKLKAFPLKSGMRQGCPLSTLL
jgi:hypothetical protein